jgi:hypothetical protein
MLAAATIADACVACCIIAMLLWQALFHHWCSTSRKHAQSCKLRHQVWRPSDLEDATAQWPVHARGCRGCHSRIIASNLSMVVRDVCPGVLRAPLRSEAGCQLGACMHKPSMHDWQTACRLHHFRRDGTVCADLQLTRAMLLHKEHATAKPMRPHMHIANIILVEFVVATYMAPSSHLPSNARPGAPVDAQVADRLDGLGGRQWLGPVGARSAHLVRGRSGGWYHRGAEVCLVVTQARPAPQQDSLQPFLAQ